MNYNLLALLYTLGVAILDVLIRAFQRERDQAWAISVVGSVVGTLILFEFTPFSVVYFTSYSVMLLTLSGCLWSLMIYWDFKAEAYADAALNVLVGSSRMILMMLIGISMFGERLGPIDFLGGAFILAGVLTCLGELGERNRRGIRLRLLSIFAGAAAVTVDKILVSLIDIRMVVFMGYFLPSIFWIALRPPQWREQLKVSGAHRIALFSLIILLYVVIGPIFVMSFGQGEVSGTFMIAQTKSVIVLLLGFVFLNERDFFMRRLLGAALCSLGLVCVLVT